jgi:hypothetical protein
LLLLSYYSLKTELNEARTVKHFTVREKINPVISEILKCVDKDKSSKVLCSAD